MRRAFEFPDAVGLQRVYIGEIPVVPSIQCKRKMYDVGKTIELYLGSVIQFTSVRTSFAILESWLTSCTCQEWFVMQVGQS